MAKRLASQGGIEEMKTYVVNILESLSQVLNTLHGGDPNQTFSARVASHRDGNASWPAWYWTAWAWSFETFWPGHLDWAKGDD